MSLKPQPQHKRACKARTSTSTYTHNSKALAHRHHLHHLRHSHSKLSSKSSWSKWPSCKCSTCKKHKCSTRCSNRPGRSVSLCGCRHCLAVQVSESIRICKPSIRHEVCHLQVLFKSRSIVQRWEVYLSERWMASCRNYTCFRLGVRLSCPPPCLKSSAPTSKQLISRQTCPKSLCRSSFRLHGSKRLELSRPPNFSACGSRFVHQIT